MSFHSKCVKTGASMIFKEITLISYALLQINKFFSISPYPRSFVDPFHTSKLLTGYFKLGRINDAQKLFEEIPDKNVVSCSIMIHGYTTNGFHREAFKIFFEMQNSSLVPNSFTMVSVLVSSASLGDMVLGQSVHGLIVKSGLESNLFVETAILDMYAKCGYIVDSYKFFEQMNSPCLISCNAMVAGFIYNKLFEEAFVLFDQIRLSGLLPSSVTMLSVIQCCIALESHGLCESIHCLVVKTGFCSDLSVINSVLDMYSNLEDLEAATKIFNKMTSKDVISWTTIIGLLVRLEHASVALKLFCKMRDNGVNLDIVVLVNLIVACALLGDLKRGRSVHTQTIVNGFGMELLVANSIVSMYSKCGDLDSSITVFDRIMEKSLVSWTAMISGCVQNGWPRNALGMLTRMRVEENFDLDSIALVSLIAACGELSNLVLCQQLHCYVTKAGFPKYKSIQNSLISTYSKCGDVELAHKIFNEMGSRDIVSWNAIISGYGINGFGEAALALFQEMESSGIDPDCVTYLSMLSACSHSGLMDDGLMVYNRMVEEERIRPGKEHFGCVVDMLARAGRLSDATGFMSMLSEGMDLDAWKALLGGCQIHDDVRLAELAAEKVSKLALEEPSHVVLLSNVYKSVGMFEEAESLRLSMRMKGMVKNPGISLVNGGPLSFS